MKLLQFFFKKIPGNSVSLNLGSNEMLWGNLDMHGHQQQQRNVAVESSSWKMLRLMEEKLQPSRNRSMRGPLLLVQTGCFLVLSCRTHALTLMSPAS